MILRTDIFPNGVIVVRLKTDDPTAPLGRVTYLPNEDLPSSDHPQALAIAQLLWTPELIDQFIQSLTH
jgi:hypothetical protein